MEQKPTQGDSINQTSSSKANEGSSPHILWMSNDLLAPMSFETAARFVQLGMPQSAPAATAALEAAGTVEAAAVDFAASEPGLLALSAVAKTAVQVWLVVVLLC